MLLELLLGALCFIFLQLTHPPPPPLIPPFKLSPQSAAPLPDDLHDNSDWFSGLRPTGSDGEPAGEADTSPVQEREIPPTNFRILGIDLSPDMFKPIELRFGKLHEVQRGDAASGRSQACYVSANGESKVHLIFEQGEVNSSVHIFVGGPTGTAAIAASLQSSSPKNSPQRPASVLASRPPKLSPSSVNPAAAKFPRPSPHRTTRRRKAVRIPAAIVPPLIPLKPNSSIRFTRPGP
jgi:hypothetical protein